MDVSVATRGQDELSSGDGAKARPELVDVILVERQDQVFKERLAASEPLGLVNGPPLKTGNVEAHPSVPGEGPTAEGVGVLIVELATRAKNAIACRNSGSAR